MKLKFRFNLEIITVILFFSLFMMIQRMNNIYLLTAYFFFGELAIYFYLTFKKKVGRNAKRLFLIMLFFWFQEFASAQEQPFLRYSLYFLEVLLIIYLFCYGLKHRKKRNRHQFNITTFVLIGLLFVNFISTMLTYGNLSIFLYSSYDSCKYFALIYYVLALNTSMDEFKDLLDLLAGIVIMHAFCALIQFTGSETFFDIFRGRFKIVTRTGNFRAIGMFPYGIELGNYSCILFALYYNYSKMLDKSIRGFYIFIEVLLVLCVLVSGTRTSMANIIFLVIISNVNSVRGWAKTGLILMTVVIAGSNLINIEEVITRTKWDMSIELPRTYYMKKGIEIWKDNPLFGIGFNTYGSAKYRKRTNDVIFNTYNAHDFDYANLATTDSFMVEIIPEFGILGISILLFFTYEVIRQYRKKRINKQYYKMFIILNFSILVMSFNTSTAFINPHIGSWFWISCGFLLGEDFDRSKVT